MELSLRLQLWPGAVGIADWVVSDGDNEVTVLASDITHGPENLIRAVTELVHGAEGARAAFEAEPTNFRWIFRRLGRSEASVRLLKVPDCDSDDEAGVELWMGTVGVAEIGRALLGCFEDAARRYGLPGYERGWGRPYPADLLEALKCACGAA